MSAERKMSALGFAWVSPAARISDPDPAYDPDLQEALERGGESGLREAAEAICKCGHPRRDHMAATGALGSFGGSACDRCWTCPTFRRGDD